jgi:hypothetical protein
VRFVVGAATVLYAVTSLVVLGAIVAAPPYDPGFYFDGQRLVNDYSGVLLFTCALLSLANFRITRDFRSSLDPRRRLSSFWALCVVGYVLLAADEFLEFHGTINVAITHTLLGFHRNPALTRLDALVLAAYGIGASAVLYHFRHELARIPCYVALMLAAGAFGAVSVAVDLLVRESATSLYVEEGAKIFAAASLVLSCLTATAERYLQLRLKYGIRREPLRAEQPAEAPSRPARQAAATRR